jgi:amino acid transporter
MQPGSGNTDSHSPSPVSLRPAGEAGLRRGALRLPAVLMQGIGHTAPATAILLTLPITTSYAGAAAPLAYLLAFLLVLMLGVGVTQLARHLPSAGGYYTYVSRTIHPRAGFLIAWLFFLYAPVTAAFSLAMMGFVLESSLRAEYGGVFPWWLFLLLGTAFTFWVTYRGIEISAAALTVLGLLEMGIVLLLAAWGLFVPGPGGVDLSTFNPANAVGGPGLFSLGVVFSIFALTGWEGVAPLAEESANPRRVVPQALLGTILIMGFFLVFTAWGILVGWGTQDLQALTDAKDKPPFEFPLVLARRFWGSGWLIVLFALINSMAAVSVAASLVSTRMWYAMARSGSLPAWFAAMHARCRTPVNAVLFQTFLTLLIGLGLGFWIGPDQEFFLMGEVLTLALALIYTAGNLGVFRFYRRERRDEFHPLWHAFFPLVSSFAVLGVAYLSVTAWPPPPLRYAPFIVGGWLGLGVAVLVLMKALGHEQWLLQAGAATQEAGASAVPDPPVPIKKAVTTVVQPMEK